ncbi:MAG: HlyD family type I secretion periplasmic adaptor subunit [Candidatus Accumulibacter sp.]|jgi:hemolysin D|nr:HlyD family type I secretion periplasmic adaptor subunit [Accumulibacter sp.]
MRYPQSLALYFDALKDFGRRYREIFRIVWAERHALDTTPRLRHETEFLPAALELQETPVSPAPRVAMWLLIAFAAIAVLWSIFGHIDVVASARGKTVPSEGSKVVQPMETAVVRTIYVKDGREVKKGDILIELDATATSADAARLDNDTLTNRLQAARSRALLDAIDARKPPKLASMPDVPQERYRHEQRVLEGQYGEFQSRLSRIEAEIERRDAELRSTREIVKKLEKTAPIARQRARDYKQLVNEKFMSQHGYLDKEQLRIEQEADLATQRGRVQELQAALQEGHGELSTLIAETRRVAFDTYNDASQKATASEQELIKANIRNRQMTLVAPVDGTIQQLAIHTVGGVVTPAQPLMIVVPKDAPLEVEAFLENKDIGFVNPGQDAEIKVETFPFTRFGTIAAKVISVSHDAILDEKTGMLSYSSRLQLSKPTMQIGEKTIRLTPGMAVTAEIKTDRRRVIEYFLSPLIQYKQESLRER